jgi:outer membrane biosynthesis protein TonB
MRSGKLRSRRKQPTERQKPFFDKQGDDHSKFFSGSSDAVQRKLNISKANDPLEAEAESAAKKINAQQVQKAEKKEEEPVQKAEKKEEEKPVQKAEKKEEEPVQKAEKKEEEPVQKAEKKEEEPVQKAEKKEEEPVQKAEKKEEEPAVQAKLDSRVQPAAEMTGNESGEPAHADFEKRLAGRKGRGFALPDDLRTEMEQKFGTSFKQVRIHTDPEAAAMCEEIHALAFTHGNDIYFNEGMYAPGDSSGRELLAHELAHVVQQNG